MPSGHHFPGLASSWRPAWAVWSLWPAFSVLLCHGGLQHHPGIHSFSSITRAPLSQLLNVTKHQLCARDCAPNLWWYSRGQKIAKTRKEITSQPHWWRGNAFINCTQHYSSHNKIMLYIDDEYLLEKGRVSWIWVITVGNLYVYNPLLMNINAFNEGKTYYLKQSILCSSCWIPSLFFPLQILSTICWNVKGLDIAQVHLWPK